MKKISLVVAGLAVVIGVVLLLAKERSKVDPSQVVGLGAQELEERSTAEDAEYAEPRKSTKSVQSVDEPSLALSDAVKALLGLDGKKHNYPSLLKAINELDREMSATDVAALREMLNFLNDRFPETMRPIEINAVKNDVLDKLLRQKQLPEGLGLQMVAMAGNAANDPVWRDYCIQFMAPFYERRSKEGAGNVEQTFQSAHSEGGQTGKSAPQEELAAIHDAMFQALDERGETLAGTALIGLELLSRTHEEFDRETIVAKATEIASDEMASAAARLTALRLAAGISSSEQGIPNDEVIGAARSIAQTGETVLLRSAAIVTLGEVGTPDDRELLESYLLDENKQITDAARMALAKMGSRN